MLCIQNEESIKTHFMGRLFLFPLFMRHAACGMRAVIQLMCAFFYVFVFRNIVSFNWSVLFLIQKWTWRCKDMRTLIPNISCGRNPNYILFISIWNAAINEQWTFYACSFVISSLLGSRCLRLSIFFSRNVTTNYLMTFIKFGMFDVPFPLSEAIYMRASSFSHYSNVRNMHQIRFRFTCTLYKCTWLNSTA